jgi:transposase
MDTSQKLETTQRTELRNILDNPGSTKEEFRRAQAILLLDQEVMPAAVSAITRYNRRHIFRLRRRYMAEGKEAIKDKRTPKPKALLTEAQRAEVIETIKTKRPAELGTYYQHYSYWTTGILGEYIKRTYKVEYKSKTSECLLFKAIPSPKSPYLKGLLS